MIKIVIDAFGADKGPEVIVKGALDALALKSDMRIIICGDAGVISAELSKYDYDKTRIIIEDAKEQITNEESPTAAIRSKKDSSLVRALELTKTDPEVVGMISAGSTGAVLAGGIFKVGRIKGVLRPALCPVLPTMTGGKVCIVDCGANVDCRPEYLEQFALMGSNYMKAVCGIENPRVALVSVGVEDKKGNELTHEVFERLKKQPVNFVGNMEARDALSGNYDVLVCDGFVGNVLLKSIEGTASMVMKMMKKEILGSFSAKIGAVFMKKALGNLKTSMDYHAFGGAAFLGVEKIVIKSHGSSNAKAITACVDQVVKMHELNLIPNIKAAISASLAAKEEKTEND